MAADTTKGPIFQPAAGDRCDVKGCPRMSMYNGLWPNHVVKAVCEVHKKAMSDKDWPEISDQFRSIPPK
jgi:hypothetical protein